MPLKGAMVRRVPVPCEENGEPPCRKTAEVFRPHGNNGVAAGNAKGAAGKKIILDVNEDEGVVRAKRFHTSGRFCRKSG